MGISHVRASDPPSSAPPPSSPRDPLAIPAEVKASIKILLVDDDRSLRESCASVLQMDGYSVTLAGLSIGSGSWVINIREDEFSAVANGTTAGLGRVFASGQGYSSVHGTIAAGQLAPAVYTTSIRTGQEEYEVRMVFSGGNVIDFAAQPPNTSSPDRIPLTEIDRQAF